MFRRRRFVAKPVIPGGAGSSKAATPSTTSTSTSTSTPTSTTSCPVSTQVVPDSECSGGSPERLCNFGGLSRSNIADSLNTSKQSAHTADTWSNAGGAQPVQNEKSPNRVLGKSVRFGAVDEQVSTVASEAGDIKPAMLPVKAAVDSLTSSPEKPKDLNASGESPSKKRRSQGRFSVYFDSNNVDVESLTICDLTRMVPIGDRMKFPGRPQGTGKQEPNVDYCSIKREAGPVSSAPQVKIGADGSVILDENSLYISRAEGEPTDDMGVVMEDENTFRRTPYGVNGRKTSKKSKPWTSRETKRFYKYLSFTGLDFCLLEKAFKTRTEAELRRKYSRENRDYPDLLDRILSGKCRFNFTEASSSNESEPDEDQSSKDGGAHTEATKKKRKRSAKAEWPSLAERRGKKEPSVAAEEKFDVTDSNNEEQRKDGKKPASNKANRKRSKKCKSEEDRQTDGSKSTELVGKMSSPVTAELAEGRVQLPSVPQAFGHLFNNAASQPSAANLDEVISSTGHPRPLDFVKGLSVESCSTSAKCRIKTHLGGWLNISKLRQVSSPMGHEPVSGQLVYVLGENRSADEKVDVHLTIFQLHKTSSGCPSASYSKVGPAVIIPPSTTTPASAPTSDPLPVWVISPNSLSESLDKQALSSAIFDSLKISQIANHFKQCYGDESVLIERIHCIVVESETVLKPLFS